MAIVEQLSLRLGTFKEGDEFKWEATLSGTVKVTKRHLGAAMEQWLKKAVAPTA